MRVTRYEVPALDDFVLDTDADESALVWMQCRICLETWQVVTLGDAVHQWNEHVCKEKANGSGT